MISGIQETAFCDGQQLSKMPHFHLGTGDTQSVKVLNSAGPGRSAMYNVVRLVELVIPPFNNKTNNHLLGA